MALSKRAVDIAYTVFNLIKSTHLPDLEIGSWPPDISDWKHSTWEDLNDFRNAKENKVYGWDKKNDGWENLFFWTKKPSQALKDDFLEWAEKVPNSHMSNFDKKTGMWVFGWF